MLVVSDQHPVGIYNGRAFTTWTPYKNAKLRLINTMPEWKAFFARLMEQKLVACDTETTGFDWYIDSEIVGMSFGWEDDHFYIPVRHEWSLTGGETPTQLRFEDIKDDLQTFFSQTDVSTIWHNCMHADSAVNLADGTRMRVADMVNQKHPGPVLTLNEETGQVEEKKVVNWLKGDLRPNNEWLNVRTVGKGNIQCTVDHEVITSRGRVRADGLVPGDLVATSTPSFTPLYRQFLLGTLLGDSCIQTVEKCISPAIHCAHADSGFAAFKARMFNSDVVERPNNRGYSSHLPDATLFWARMSNDERLQEIAEVVRVSGKKTINEHWISQIDVPAVAMWYCDDGTLAQGRYPSIVSILPENLEQPLIDRLSAIGFSGASILRRSSGGVVDIYLERGSLPLLAKYVPPEMARKLPEGLRGQCITWEEDRYSPSDVLYSKVTSVTPLFQKEGRKGKSSKHKRTREFCIAVEGNQNFFVSGGSLCVSNCKFDMHFYHREGIKIKTPFHETRVLWHLLDENAPGKLKVIASGWRDTLGRWCEGILDKDANAKEKEIDKWRGEEAKARRKAYAKAIMDKADELAREPEYQGWKRVPLKQHIAQDIINNHPYEGCKKEDIHYGMVPVDLMCEYAGLDTYLTWALYKHCMQHLKWSKQLSALYFNELKLNQLLQITERAGIEVNAQKLRDLGDDLDKRIASRELSVRTTLGDINLNSSDQLAQAFLGMGIPLTKKTAAGKYQLDKKVLDKLKKKHQIVQDILDLRADKKIRSTYVEGILSKLVDDRVLHCSFNQNVSTGRMSASNPNLMNIPRANTVIREAFPPPEDHLFVFMDYSQVEVRLTAHFSQDPILLEAYATGRDIHTTTMCQMFGYDYPTVTGVLAEDPDHPMHKRFKGLRAVSKCVHPSTVLRSPDGGALVMSSLSFSETAGEFSGKGMDIPVCGTEGSPSPVTDTYNNGVQELLHVVTNRGTVTCTPEHQFALASGELLRAGDLSEAVVLQEPPTVPLIPKGNKAPLVSWKPHTDCPETRIRGSAELAYVGGLFIGDGSVSGNNSVCITHGQVARKDAMGVSYSAWQQIISTACTSAGLVPRERGKNVYLGSRSVLRLFTALGLVDPTRETDPHSQKSFRIPQWVWEGGREFLLSFLGGLADSAGCVCKLGALSITTKSPILAGHVCEAFRALGALPSLERSYNAPYDKYYYRVRINREYSRMFAPFMQHPGKVKRLSEGTPMQYRRKGKPHRVLAVTPAGALQSVDISVGAEDHMYISNGILTHNTLNFGIIYGVSAFSLSEQIERPEIYEDLTEDQWVDKCQEFIDQYMSTYRGVKRFIAHTKRQAHKEGLVTNTFGRTRRLPNLEAVKLTKNVRNKWMERSAERQAVNYKIQGEAADIFKVAAVRIHAILRGKKSRLVNFVHDEVQLYMHKDELDLLPKIKAAMEDFHYSVPLVVESEYSETSWGEKKDLKVS